MKTPRDVFAECRRAGSLPADASRKQIEEWIEIVIHNCGTVARTAHTVQVSEEATALQRSAWAIVERHAQEMLDRAGVLGRKSRITPQDISGAGKLYDTFISSMNVLMLRYNETELALEVPLTL